MICVVCKSGCGLDALESFPASSVLDVMQVAPEDLLETTDRVLRNAKQALLARSPAATRRWLGRARDLGASSKFLAALRRCEPMRMTISGRLFHEGCRPADVGRCFGCGVWLDHAPAGPGCPACQAGKTPSGGPEAQPLSPEELARMEERITGIPATPPPEDRRLEAIQRMQRMLAEAAGVISSTGKKKDEEVTGG